MADEDKTIPLSNVITIDDERIAVAKIVMTGNIEPLDAKAVTVTLANPRAGVEPVARSAYEPGDGSWRIDAFTIPLPGTWSARIDVVMPDSTTVTLEGRLRFGRDQGVVRQ